MTDDREYVETAKMEAFGYTVPEGSDDYKKGFQDGVDFVLDRFYNLPREDVEPIVHAYWIRRTWDHRNDYYDVLDYPYRCSACREKSKELTKRCPNCGARMDGKVEK